MANDFREDNEAAIAARSLRYQAIERLNSDFGLLNSQVNGTTAKVKEDQARGKVTPKISGWWMPTGIVFSIAAKYFGLKPVSYSSYMPYAIGMGCVLLMFLLGMFFFKKLPEDNIRYDLSSGPPVIVKMFGWQMALMAFILGWLLGDLVLVISRIS